MAPQLVKLNGELKLYSGVPTLQKLAHALVCGRATQVQAARGPRTRLDWYLQASVMLRGRQGLAPVQTLQAMHTLASQHQRTRQESDGFKANAPVSCPGAGAGTGDVAWLTGNCPGSGTGTAAAGAGTVAAGGPPGVLCGLMDRLPAEPFCNFSQWAQLS